MNDKHLINMKKKRQQQLVNKNFMKASKLAVVTRLICVMGSFAIACASSQAFAVRGLGGRAGFFLELDASILEPDLDLLLTQLQVGGNFNAPQTRQIDIGLELLLKVEQLTAGEGCAHSSRV